MNLLVMAKEPMAGRSKTRLCPPCTPAQAAELAEAALADTLEVVACLAGDEVTPVLALDGRPGSWLPAGFRVIAQRGNGFDERLANAWDDTGGPTLQIGMDTPQVTVELLAAALTTLSSPGTDAVLGRASDGGWWALGLHRPDRRVFVGVPMSTATTGAFQLAQLRSLDLTVSELPELRDVDLFDDAVSVATSAPGTRFAAALNRTWGQIARQCVRFGTQFGGGDAVGARGRVSA